MTTLILGTCYVADDAMRHVVTMWCGLVNRLNYGTDVLLVDSASPISPVDFTPTSYFMDYLVLGNNVGHLSRGGKDGWGRAICKGIEYAIANDYTYLAYIDADILFSRPVQKIIDKMVRCGVKIAAPMEPQYLFVENGLFFAEVAYLRDSEFVKRYDWENPPRDGRLPERRFEDLVSDELFTLPLRGLRNDYGRITRDNVGMSRDWITHCTDLGVYDAFLKVNGIEL